MAEGALFDSSKNRLLEIKALQKEIECERLKVEFFENKIEVK